MENVCPWTRLNKFHVVTISWTAGRLGCTEHKTISQHHNTLSKDCVDRLHPLQMSGSGCWKDPLLEPTSPAACLKLLFGFSSNIIEPSNNIEPSPIRCSTVLLGPEQNKLTKCVISSWANLMEGAVYLLVLCTWASVSSGEKLWKWKRTLPFCHQIIRAPWQRVQCF